MHEQTPTYRSLCILVCYYDIIMLLQAGDKNKTKIAYAIRARSYERIRTKSIILPPEDFYSI